MASMMPVATNKDCWGIEWIQERSSLSSRLQDNEIFSRLPPVMVLVVPEAVSVSMTPSFDQPSKLLESAGKEERCSLSLSL
jgi:hypothetical protein